MEKVLLLLCMVGTVHCFMSELHHVLRKRQADLIDFNEECTSVFTTMDVKCLTNIYSLVESYKTIEKAAVATWATQCQTSIYDCMASPDGDTSEVIEYFKVMLPQIKALCADGCMVPILDLIHACLKKEALAEIGLSRSEMEDIFDLVCIQEGQLDNGKEGEYCMIKAMTTALWLFEANQIKKCNLDDIDLQSCNGQVDTSTCQCGTNCSGLIKTANALMGCCMGTLLKLEKAFNLSHPEDPNLLNPGNQLFALCGVTPGPPCKTSKEVIAHQKQMYKYCYDALAANTQSQCIDLEDEVHTKYLMEMQNINKTCKSFKNINQCRNVTSKTELSEDLKNVLSRLNNHCGECKEELAGIRENCTVFLPNEAKMVFGMMCLRNSDMEHCGPRIIKYEGAQGRVDFNSNPCFAGFMPKVQNTCSQECAAEVDLMNKNRVLNCFDALISYTNSPNVEWQLWHRNCVKLPNIDVSNKINATAAFQFSTNETTDPVMPLPVIPLPVIPVSPQSGTSSEKTSIIKTVAYTFVGTVLIAFVIVGAIVILYKRQMILNMFGYSTFREGDDNLITDVHMEDTIGPDYENRGENYYD